MFLFFWSLTQTGFWKSNDVSEGDNSKNSNPEEQKQKKEELKNKILGASACKSVDDCEIVASHCPFGCHVAVAGDRVNEIKDLLIQYPEECEQTCRFYKKLACEEGRCVVKYY